MEEKSTCFSLPSLLSGENMYFCSCVKQRIADVQSLYPEVTLFLRSPTPISVISSNSYFNASREKLEGVKVIMCCFSSRSECEKKNGKTKMVLLKFPSLQSHALKILKRIRTRR